MRDIFGGPHERDMREGRARYARRHHHPERPVQRLRDTHREMHRGRRGRGRVPRGDVRTAVLLLLTEEPMHGYQLMQAIADRTGGRWQPSPGAIYPTISQLEDEGLVTLTASAGRKLVTLTDAGRGYVTGNTSGWADPFTPFVGEGEETVVDLRDALEQVQAAVRQVARTGTAAQAEAAGKVLADTRRSLYLLLAGEAEPETDEDTAG
jgi:DNA-binding PadR family transcriptional regulator